jgi:hypothetical protein
MTITKLLIRVDRKDNAHMIHFLLKTFTPDHRSALPEYVLFAGNGAGKATKYDFLASI